MREPMTTISRADVVHVDGEPVPKTPRTLRERCQEFLAKLALDPALRQRSADALAEFVMIERGRAADASLKGTLPVVLYFADDAGRDEFMAVVHDAIPGMTARKWP